MCPYGKFHAFWRDEYGPDIRFGQVAYDVECLEIVPEPVMTSYRNGEEQPAVVPAVECGLYRIDVQFLAEIEDYADERYPLYIYLYSESAVPFQAFQGIRQPSVHEIPV